MTRYLVGEAIFVAVLALVAIVTATAVASAFLLVLGVLVLACSGAIGYLGLTGGIR